jgi:hypothetical protein
MPTLAAKINVAASKVVGGSSGSFFMAPQTGRIREVLVRRGSHKTTPDVIFSLSYR